MADWTDWADGSDLAGVSRSTSPLTSAGYDPDDLRANPQLRQQVMQSIGSPYGLSAIQPPAPKPTIGPAAPSVTPSAGGSSPRATTSSTGASPGAGMVLPTGPSSSGSGQRNTELDAMSQEALHKGLELGGFAQSTAQDLAAGPPPEIAASQQKVLQDTAPTPLKDASGNLLPQYKPTGWQKFGRGVKDVALGLVEGGIPGAIAGGIDPELIRGGTDYNAPNKAYLGAEAARQRNLAADTAELGNLQGRFKEMTDARKAALEGTRTGATAVGDVLTGVKNLETQDVNRQKNDTQLRKAGYKLDDSGAIVPLDRSEMSPAQQVQMDLHAALQEQAEARAALAEAQNDPNSPAFKLAQQRASTANANAAAAAERASAYALMAAGRYTGIDPKTGKPIVAATLTPSGQPMGSANAGSFTKHEQNVAQFNDVLGATDQLENTARRLVAKGGKGALSDSIVAAALAEPEGTFGKWMQGQVANGQMTPEQRDYVTNLRAFRENLQALRKSAGGGVSDSQVDRLMEMAPGAATPDLDFLLRQTGQIRATANRLSKGLPMVVGGTPVEGQGQGAPPAAGAGQGSDWFSQHPKATTGAKQ